MNDIFVLIFRAALLFIIVIIAMRLMGKRQIGELQPFELAVAILISELAAMPMQDLETPIYYGIISIAVLTVMQLLISFLSIKSNIARKVICGRPRVLIQNGKIQEGNLKKEMYTINDLLEQLRIKDVSNISEVEYAILETNGQLSIIMKSQFRAVIPKDLNLKTQYEGPTVTLIIDGKPIRKNLDFINQDLNWLKKQIEALGYQDISHLFFASIDTQGQIYTQYKDKYSDLYGYNG